MYWTWCSVFSAIHLKNKRTSLTAEGASWILYMDVQFSSVQFSSSVMSDSVTPWTAASQASLSITSSWSLLKLMSIESVMPSNHLIFYHPLLLLPSIFPSIRVLSSESVLQIRSATVFPMNIQDWFPLGLSGLISLQSTGLSRFFSNTTAQKHQFSVLTFFIVQLSHPYMTTGKTIVLTRWIFVGKVMSLLFIYLFIFGGEQK